MRKIHLIGAVILMTAGAASATLINGGFEDPVLGDGVQTTPATVPPSWNSFVFFQGYTLNPAAADPVQPTEGDNYLVTLDSIVYQSIGVLAADTVYTFSMDYYPLATGSDFTIMIANGGLAPIVPSAGAAFGAGDLTIGQWQPISVQLDTSVDTGVVGQGAFVRLGTAGLATSNGYLDNVSVTATAIPEPGTMGLMALFGGILLFVRNRIHI